MTDDTLVAPNRSVLDLPLTLKSDLEVALRRLGLHPSEKALELRPLQLAGAWGYASSACMALAKEARQAPQQLAETVAAALPAHPEIARVEALRGYLNFHVDVPVYAGQLVREVLARGDAWGQGRPKTGRVMVEYAQPNTHKAVHVGHLRNIALGAAVVYILRTAGWEVIAATYPGDIGMHVIRCLWCYIKYHNGQEPATGRGRWLSKVYSEADARLEYKKHVVELLGTALRDSTLGPRLAQGLQALGESAAEVREEVAALLHSLEMAGPDPDPETPHEPDEELGADLSLADTNPAVLTRMWEVLAEVLAPDHELYAEFQELSAHWDWLERVADWRQEVRDLYKQWELQDPDLLALWRRTRQWSIDEFKEIFKTLSAPIDVEFYESELEEEGRAIVEELIRLGIAEDGRPHGETVYIKLDEKLRRHPVLSEKYHDQLWRKDKDGNLVERNPYRVLVVLRSDSTTLYSTKDLALAKRKFEEYGVDRSIYVIDVRQSLYFQQVFKALELWGFPQAELAYHLGYEMVGTKEGAFSSRKGNAPLYEDFEQEALRRAREIVDRKQAELLERGTEDERRLLDDAEREAVAEAVGIGGLKWGMLDKDNNTFIAFDWEQALNPNTQSAPYIQYAHARTCSLLEKAAAAGIRLTDDAGQPLAFDYADLSSYELALLEVIGRFPEEIERAAATLKPVVITGYLLGLADALNNFWHNCPILKAERPEQRLARVALTAAARQTLANGLHVLGIAAPAVM
jgi:arginyl-tRNA synthetase